MADKITIELDAYNAMEIVCFVNDILGQIKNAPIELQSIKDALDELEHAIAPKLNDELWAQIRHERQANILLGKIPNNSNGQ